MDIPAPKRTSPERIVIYADSINVEARDAISRAYDAGTELETLGTFVKHALQELFDFQEFEAANTKASRLRCLAQQALHLGFDLTRHAGRLEAIGEVRRAADPGDHSDEPVLSTDDPE